MDATVTVEYYENQASSTTLPKVKWTFHRLLSFQMKRTNHPSLYISSVMKRFRCRNTSCVLILGEASRIQEECSTKGYQLQDKVLSAHLAFWCKNSVFERPFSCNPNKVDITKDACVLHNYILHHDVVLSTPRTDQELTNAYNLFPQPPQLILGRTTTTEQQMRDGLCEHFLDPRNAIDSQFNACV